MNNSNSKTTQNSQGLKVKTNIKAGLIREPNHNQTVRKGLRVKANIKAGLKGRNHLQSLVQGLKVKSNLKAGILATRERNHNQTLVPVAKKGRA